MIDILKNFYSKYREIILYLVYGVLTTLISLIVYYLFSLTIINPNNPFQLQVANIISWISGVTFAYITNRNVVFKSNNENKLKEATDFVLARTLTLIMDMLIMFIGVSLFRFNDKFIKIISQIVVVISNYIFSKLFVFKI